MNAGKVCPASNECVSLVRFEGTVKGKQKVEPRLDPSARLSTDIIQWMFASFSHLRDICHAKGVSKTWHHLIATCNPLWKRYFLERYEPPINLPEKPPSGFWHERYIFKRVFEYNLRRNQFAESTQDDIPCRFLPRTFFVDTKCFYTVKNGHLHTYDLTTGTHVAARSVVRRHSNAQDVKICEIRDNLGIFEGRTILAGGASRYTLHARSLTGGQVFWHGKQDERYLLPTGSTPLDPFPRTFPVYTRQNLEGGIVVIRSRDPKRGQVLAENVIKPGRHESIIPKVSHDGETLIIYTKRSASSSHQHYVIIGAAVQKVALKAFDVPSGTYCVEQPDPPSPRLLSFFPLNMGLWLMKPRQLAGISLTADRVAVIFEDHSFMIVDAATGAIQCETTYPQQKNISSFRLFDDRLLITHKTRPPVTLAFDTRTGALQMKQRFSRLSCRWIIGREGDILISYHHPYIGFWNIRTGKFLRRERMEKRVNRVVYQSGCLFIFSRSEEAVRVRVRNYRPLSIMPEDTIYQEKAELYPAI